MDRGGAGVAPKMPDGADPDAVAERIVEAILGEEREPEIRERALQPLAHGTVAPPGRGQALVEHRAKARMQREDLTVLAYRFEGDPFCRAERFAAYAEALGDRFVGRVLPDASANPEGIARMPPHSVVTAHLIDREGEPTRQALDEILGFFKLRLVA